MYYAYIRAREHYHESDIEVRQREAILYFAETHDLSIDRWFVEPASAELHVLHEMIGHMHVHHVDTVITYCFPEEFERWKEAPDLAPLIALGLGIKFVDARAMLQGHVAVDYHEMVRELIELRAIYDEQKAHEASLNSPALMALPFRR